MKTTKAVLGLVLATAIATAPIASANARGWDHHGGGHWGGGHGGYYGGRGPGPVLGFAGAVLGATVALATAPFVLASNIVSPGPVYAEASYPQEAPQAVYAQPQYAQAYPQPVYAPAPGYYHYVRAPQPVYAYGPPPGYAYVQPGY
jgi:hypothetical protein